MHAPLLTALPFLITLPPSLLWLLVVVVSLLFSFFVLTCFLLCLLSSLSSLSLSSQWTRATSFLSHGSLQISLLDCRQRKTNLTAFQRPVTHRYSFSTLLCNRSQHASTNAMEQKSVVSNRTRSRFSSASSKALAVRAELEMAKAGLLFVERENKLREAKAKMESEEKTVDAQREIALKEAALKAFEEYVSLSEGKSSIHLDQTPADPMQRTREYVAEQTAQLISQPAAPQLVQSSALQHIRSSASQFDQPTNSEASFYYFPDPKTDPSDDRRRRYSTENRHDHSSDLTRYFARRELLQASMLKFSDRPKDYQAWKRSFRNSIVDLRVKKWICL
ncbi:unnamed protein product [Acanthosepion pharaonis]|uniref:Uncharacterized protein n=1 Tax=Acanthosepion pharaonis TaxID=158019 RepID=A0A812DD24_ACAPH|nr:unnamed protein product [Sepia pharaonis]